MKKIFTAVLLSVFTLALFAQTDVIPPQLHSPSDGDTDQMPDALLDWYATAGIGVITYTMELDLDMDFTSPVVFTMDTSAARMEELVFGESYYWRVKAADESGDESTWSDIFSFTVMNRLNINKPNDGDTLVAPDVEVKWKTNYSGSILSGVSFIDCQIDTSYYWQSTNQSITSEHLYGVSSLDGKSWAVGAGGTILYYDGNTWMEQTSGINDDLLATLFIDENNGWAVGEGGIIIYYNGTDWTEQTSPVGDDLFSVSFVDANNGWAVGEGGIIIYYDGTDWTEQTSNTSDDLFGVSFLDANTGVAVGDGGVILAFDGTEWAEQTNPASKDLFAISIYDASNAWASGKSGSVVYFNGTEWIEQESETNMDLYFITAVSANEVWSGGEEESGMVIFDGVEWLEVTSGTLELLNSCSIFNDDFGFMVGDNGTIISKNADAFSSPISEILSTHADSSKLPLSELYFGKDYFFRIRGRHSEGNSLWSSVNYFKTIAKPVNVAPESGSTGQMLDVTIEWEEISGTYDYIYELCSDPDFSYSCTGYSDSNSFIPQGVVFGETYYWHVKARHSVDTTDWSNTWSFTVINQMTHVSPGDASYVTDLFPILEWEEVTGVDGYYVRYADNENMEDAEISKIADPELNTFTVPELLGDGETYYWSTRAYIAGDTTEWSTPWSFTMGSSGVNELLTSNNVNIYPNPSKGLLNIKLNVTEQTPIEINISNILGEVVIKEEYLAQPGINNHNVNLESFGTGIYLIQMQTGKEVYTQRVVVDK